VRDTRSGRRTVLGLNRTAIPIPNTGPHLIHPTVRGGTVRAPGDQYFRPPLGCGGSFAKSSSQTWRHCSPRSQTCRRASGRAVAGIPAGSAPWMSQRWRGSSTRRVLSPMFELLESAGCAKRRSSVLGPTRTSTLGPLGPSPAEPIPGARAPKDRDRPPPDRARAGDVRLLRTRWLSSAGKAPDDFVFTTSTGRPLVDGHVGHAFLTAVRRAGVRGDGRLSLHGLRYAYPLLIEEGLDMVLVSCQLGHADPGVTLSVYAHTFARAEDALVARSALQATYAAYGADAVVAGLPSNGEGAPRGAPSLTFSESRRLLRQRDYDDVPVREGSRARTNPVHRGERVASGRESGDQ
jgi:hypothetical protein